jgi:hypothetical protein
MGFDPTYDGLASDSRGLHRRAGRAGRSGDPEVVVETVDSARYWTMPHLSRLDVEGAQRV